MSHLPLDANSLNTKRKTRDTNSNKKKYLEHFDYETSGAVVNRLI